MMNANDPQAAQPTEETPAQPLLQLPPPQQQPQQQQPQQGGGMYLVPTGAPLPTGALPMPMYQQGPPMASQPPMYQQPPQAMYQAPSVLPDGALPPPVYQAPCGNESDTTPLVPDVKCAPVGIMMDGQSIHYGQTPARFQCQFCHYDGVTKIQTEVGVMTWVAVGGVCLFALPFGCCCCGLIPFCIDALKDTTHVCPSCGRVVGKHCIMH
eukprot:TRINITY_DN682_c0_g4_i1.p1 TRINITY_DN682_c0_g4~~TRINITY_DN682_c0_g4_i1.p1  ORF type:complete len:210 (-),score=75.67 TRINITY_DN682_c0_g4_i1:121-750(-)